MAKLHHEVVEGTSRLVNAVAASREEMLDMEHDLQDQRSHLEAERRVLANERHRESLLAPIFSNVGLMLVAALPLVLCWYLLHGLRSSDEDVSEVLMQALIDEHFPFPDPRTTRPAIEQETPRALTQEPPS